MKAGSLRTKPLLRRSGLAAAIGSMLVVAGCSSTPPATPLKAKSAIPPVTVSAQVPTELATEGESKVSQCNKELQALKTINGAESARYQREMDHLVASGQQYMNVKAGISSDINDIMTPRYQFAVANLCWKIRNALSQSLLKQADMPQGSKP